MISKRSYFSMLLVFFAVFLLFQGTQLGRVYWNPYRQGAEPPETGLRQRDVRPAQVSDAKPEDGTFAAQTGELWYVGARDTVSAAAAEEWAAYQRLALRFSARLPDSAAPGALLFVDSPALSEDKDALARLLEQGADVLLLSPPDPEELLRDAELQELLGVLQIRQISTALDGFHLFSGFLLGGERLYAEQSEADRDRQDLPRQAPWYIAGVGTKTFLQGIPTDAPALLKSENRPALFWRCSKGAGKLFVTALPMFEDRVIALGLYSAVMGQRSDWTLYPVVNARVVSLLNCPELADENPEVSAALYGRQQTDLQKNIIFPMFAAEASDSGAVASCFLAPQYDYADGAEPSPALLSDFLSEVGELRGETGLSLLHREGVSLTEKLQRDGAFLNAADPDYLCRSVCADYDELPQLRSQLGSEFLSQLRTVLLPERDELPLLGFWEFNITRQPLVSCAESHSFREDLRLLCLMTALGYSSDWFDMASALWPEREQDAWQLSSRKLFSNLSTYSAPFRGFDSVTASVADARIRRFLCVDYAARREGDTLFIRLDGLQEECFLLLRLFGEQVAESSGAEAAQLESGTWLLRATEPEIELKLRVEELPTYR